MSIQLATTPFNYHAEVQLAMTILKMDEAAAKRKHSKAREKNKSLNKIGETFTHLNLKQLPHCFLEVIFRRHDAKNLVESFLCAFITVYNSGQTNVDLRNKASFEFFEALAENLDHFGSASPTATYTLSNNASFDPMQVELVNNLAEYLVELGSTDAASSVLASCLMKIHPTHQQDIARAYRDAMLDITASHSDKVDQETLKVAKYVSAFGENVGMPYI